MARSKIVGVLAGVIALGLGTIVVPAPAEASATAYNTRTEYLTSNPNPSLPASCQTRSIYLAAGTYFWAQVLAPAQRNIALKAGTYSWEICLFPDSGYYAEGSYLTPPSGATATLYYSPIYVSQSGTYTWGDELAPPG
ncbi:MAG: hypothetical protein M3Y77_05780 [Actinomycetota bacterium]|nr:hypothetical protein [Actinomycetota bacterium]